MADPGAREAGIDDTPPAGSPVSPVVSSPAAAAGGGVANAGLVARAPVGLVASLIVHLGLAGVVAAAFLSEHQSTLAEAIPVELVQDETAASEKPPEDAKTKTEEPGAPTSTPKTEAEPAPAEPDKPAADENGPAAAAKPAPPPPPPTTETGEAIEPVDIVPPLASLAVDAVGMADSGRDTTVTKDEIEAVRAKVRGCWKIPSGWTEARQVTVTIRFALNRDGTVKGEPTVVEFQPSRFGKAAGDNAIKAVKKCAPYKLPPEKYEQWSDMQLRLPPS